PAAHRHQDAVAHDQRRAGGPEAGHAGVQLLEDVHLPALLAAVGLETAQCAGDAKRVETPLDHTGRSLGSGVEEAGERRPLVGAAPQLLAALGVEGTDLFFLLAGDARMDEDTAGGDDGDAVTLAGGDAPQGLGRPLPRLDLLGRHAIAVGPEPLRPVPG